MRETKNSIKLKCINVIAHFKHDKCNIELIVNVLILHGKFHKGKITKATPTFIGFVYELHQNSQKL